MHLLGQLRPLPDFSHSLFCVSFDTFQFKQLDHLGSHCDPKYTHNMHISSLVTYSHLLTELKQRGKITVLQTFN